MPRAIGNAGKEQSRTSGGSFLRNNSLSPRAPSFQRIASEIGFVSSSSKSTRRAGSTICNDRAWSRFSVPSPMLPHGDAPCLFDYRNGVVSAVRCHRVLYVVGESWSWGGSVPHLGGRSHLFAICHFCTLVRCCIRGGNGPGQLCAPSE